MMGEININQEVFTTREIMNSKSPILVVLHDEDGDWQFLTGEDITENNSALLSLCQILEIDNTIKEILNIPKCCMVTRVKVGSPWTRKKL